MQDLTPEELLRGVINEIMTFQDFNARDDATLLLAGLLAGWLAERDVALVAGAGGIGKSTTVADLGVALASGRPWCGVEPVRPVRVQPRPKSLRHNRTIP